MPLPGLSSYALYSTNLQHVINHYQDVLYGLILRHMPQQIKECLCTLATVILKQCIPTCCVSIVKSYNEVVVILWDHLWPKRIKNIQVNTTLSYVLCISSLTWVCLFLLSCKSWHFHSGIVENSLFLVYEATPLGKWLLTCELNSVFFFKDDLGHLLGYDALSLIKKFQMYKWNVVLSS